MGCRDMSMDMDTGMNPTDAGGDMGVRTDSATDMGSNPTDTGGNDVVMPPTDGGTVGVTIRQIQDLMDPMHPASGAHVTLNEPGLIALSSRVLIGSASGGSSATCRFAIWVGSGATGDFTGVQVQELIPLGDAGRCFDLPDGLIPGNIRPGTPISALTDMTYTEFCSGPTGVDRTMCRNWEQTQLSLRRSSTFVAGTMVNAPSPTTATVPEIGTMDATMPGSRSINLEGALVEVRNGIVQVVVNDGGFSDFYLLDAAGSTNKVQIETGNAFSATCIRNYLTGLNGMTIPSVVAPLEPEFGLWTLHTSSPSSFPGLSCSTDGGTGSDAGD
jgi:hypothetical protein